MVGEAAGFRGEDGHDAGEEPEHGEQAEAEVGDESAEGVAGEEQTGEAADGYAEDEVEVAEGAVEAGTGGAQTIEELKGAEQERERGGGGMGGDEDAVFFKNGDHGRVHRGALHVAAHVGPNSVAGDADAEEDRGGEGP